VEPQEAVRELLQSQMLGVLATSHAGHPYTSLVALVGSDDLRHIWFATSRSTHKYANLAADSRVALSIDDRSSQPVNIFEGRTVTALGTATEVPPGQHAAALQLYLARHPSLQEFATAVDTALIAVSVERYLLVTQFQKVHELRMR